MIIYASITSTIPLIPFPIPLTHQRPRKWSPVAAINGGGGGVSLKKLQSFSSTIFTPSVHPLTAAALAAVAVAVISLTAVAADAADMKSQLQQQQGDTLENVPQLLSGECVSGSKDCKKSRIQRPKSKQAESCTVKCVNTCIRGGYGSPGEGPFNIRRPLVVFKQTFRSRQYCLVECSDICNLIKDGDDGP